MQQRPRKVTVRHLERIVQRPQRRTKRVRHTREPAARRAVRIEHDERLPVRLREGRAVQVRLHDRRRRGVVEVRREDGLWVDRPVRLGAREGRGAVVVRVAFGLVW